MRKEYDVHANPECPFRRLNRVQEWQLRAPSQRGCKNLPIDADVLYMTMALIDYTLSPEIIIKWLNQVGRFLRSENKQQKEFEETVRKVQTQAMEENGMELDLENEAPIGGRIMPFEFLYLLCNA